MSGHHDLKLACQPFQSRLLVLMQRQELLQQLRKLVLCELREQENVH